MFSFLSALSPQTLAAKIGAAAIAAVAIFGFGMYAGYHWESANFSNFKTAQANAAAKQQAAQYAKENAAEKQAMVQINDLNTRLAVARKAAAAHPATGSCFDPGSLRVINGAIGGRTTAR